MPRRETNGYATQTFPNPRSQFFPKGETNEKANLPLIRTRKPKANGSHPAVSANPKLTNAFRTRNGSSTEPGESKEGSDPSLVVGLLRDRHRSLNASRGSGIRLPDAGNPRSLPLSGRGFVSLDTVAAEPNHADKNLPAEFLPGEIAGSRLICQLGA